MLELLWQCFAGTFFQVAMELRTAARTDPELRPVLVAAERSLRDRIVMQARTLFGKDVAEHPGLERALDFTLQFMIGAAMTTVLHEDPRLRELIEDFKALFPDGVDQRNNQATQGDEMTKELRFDGKVAIVTGAGGGLGRSHALLLASRGAKVVVNDLGGSFTGEGKSASAADKVVAEIKEKGGEAVANYNSVEDGDQIVKTAIDTWGRIDILINNAGILRDVSFQKMTQADWDLVYKVHVLGTFKVTHAAWNYMRDQGYGRIINTSSAAGIYGNFGQANYSMAKLGIHGFTQTLAAEGRKRNIIVNTIAPIAGSRMTETVLPQGAARGAQARVRLGARRQARARGRPRRPAASTRSAAASTRSCAGSAPRARRSGSAATITPEDVDGAWKDITSFDKAEHPGSVAESMQPIMANVEAGPSKGGNQFIDVDAALGYKYPEQAWTYDTRDVSLYALGVGAAKDPTNEADLALVYEMSGKGMKVLPTLRRRARRSTWCSTRPSAASPRRASTSASTACSTASSTPSSSGRCRRPAS